MPTFLLGVGARFGDLATWNEFIFLVLSNYWVAMLSAEPMVTFVKHRDPLEAASITERFFIFR